MQLDTPAYQSGDHYILSYDGIGGAYDAFSVTLSGAGVIQGHNYSVSVILDIGDAANGNVNETVKTVTGTFAGGSPQTIAIPSLNVPIVYTSASVHSTDKPYPPGLSATITTPVDGLTATESTFTYELGTATRFDLVYNATATVTGATSATTAAAGDVISITRVAVPGLTDSEGATGGEMSYQFTFTDQNGNNAYSALSNNLINFGSPSVTTFTVGGGVNVGDTLTLKGFINAGTTTSYEQSSIEFLNQTFTVVP